MKSIVFYLFLFFISIASFSQTIEQNFYIDFGPNDTVNGNITVNPDSNGSFWNNVFNPFATGTKFSLFNTSNASTSYELEVTNQLGANGILNGALLSPDPLLLENYAINTATEDYFFTDNFGSITLSSLNTDYGYRFKIFASRNSTENRESLYTFEGLNTSSEILQTSGLDLGGSGYHGNTSSIYNSEIIFPDCNGEIKLTITKNTNSFAYINLLEIIEYNDASISINDTKFTVMGSSVANGQGANLNQGYLDQYSSLLTQNFNAGDGLNWDYSNISIPGNNTIDVLNRWDCDLLPEQSKYVIYGLSLFNEGIRDFGNASYIQFENNMTSLINMAKAEGKTPIIANNYPNDNYNSTDYDYIKQMNLAIHEWDVASINLLGALDDGTGKYVSGYQADSSHPNTAGHTEYFYTIVPSLLDALEAGKVQPQKINNTYLTLGNSISNNQLLFTPENIIHSFTTSFEIKTSSNGYIAAFNSATGIGYLSINSSGFINYTSPSGTEITGNTILNDNNWHTITLTHYYAQGKTILYSDKVESSNYNEQLLCDHFYLHPLNSPSTIDFKDWFFYRSAMCSEEIDLLNDGKMLKSSLELYAPLDGQVVHSSNPLINLAQSTNTISEEVAITLSYNNDHVKNKKTLLNISPNPIKDFLNISLLSENSRIKKAKLFNNLGQKVKTFNNPNSIINLKEIKSGLYYMIFDLEFESSVSIKIIKE